jgi:PAS domain S-box-containing protein
MAPSPTANAVLPAPRDDTPAGAFFRHAPSLEVLRFQVLPRLLHGRAPGQPLRVWMPACGTGEDFYSLVITLLEHLEGHALQDAGVRLYATDAHAAHLAAARRGPRAHAPADALSPQRLERFFARRAGGGWTLRREVRDLCVFAPHDVTRAPPFLHLDLAVFHNLPQLPEAWAAALHRTLRPGACLWLNAAMAAHAPDGFSPLDRAHGLFTRAGQAGVAAPLPPERRTVAADLLREADRAVMTRLDPPGVLVDEHLEVIQFRGQAGEFLAPTSGVASLDLHQLVRPELRLPLRQAASDAAAHGELVRVPGIPLSSGGNVDLEVLPLAAPGTGARCLVVRFVQPPAPPPSARDGVDPSELAATRAHLQAVVGSLESGFEDLRHAREDLRALREELAGSQAALQGARQELADTRDEVECLHQELAHRNQDGAGEEHDLAWLMACVKDGLMFLDGDGLLRHFNAAAAGLFNLAASDVGRPLGALASPFPGVDLGHLVAQALAGTLAPARNVEDAQGHGFLLTVQPPRPEDGRHGCLLVARDVDQARRNAGDLERARMLGEGILSTIREYLVVLDGDFRVVTANTEFHRTFEMRAEDVAGWSLDDVAQGYWDTGPVVDGLRKLQGQELLSLRVETQTTPRRVFAIRATRVKGQALYLLAAEEVTRAEETTTALRQSEVEFRDILMTAAEAVIMAGEDGRIIFANPMAAEVFGYLPEEMHGLEVTALLPARTRQQQVAANAESVALLRGTSKDPARPRMRWDRKLHACRKDGSEFPVELVAGSLVRTEGMAVVAFITDVTKRREAEQKIQAYQHTLQQMAFDAVVAEERERRRIAAGLHDQIGQSLALTRMKLASLRDNVDGAALGAVAEAMALLDGSIADTRTLTFELSPPVLYDLGLKEALAWLVETLEKQHGLRVELVDDGTPKPLAEATAALLFRAVRELLMNVLKHADTWTARVVLSSRDDHVSVRVEDRGVGFDTSSPAGNAGSGFGLFSVHEQIRRLGGTVEILSRAGEGTRVTVRVPLRVGEGIKAPGTLETP